MKTKRINPTTTLVQFDTDPLAVVLLENGTPIAAFKNETAYITSAKIGDAAYRSLDTYMAGFFRQKVAPEWLEGFFKRGGWL